MPLARLLHVMQDGCLPGLCRSDEHSAQFTALLPSQGQVCSNDNCLSVVANSQYAVRVCIPCLQCHAVMGDFQGSAVLMHPSGLALLPSQDQVSDNHLASCYLAGKGGLGASRRCFANDG
jgi:hypothetical protein